MRLRLHVVDGTYELYRAHFSKRPSHRGPDGKDLKATTGMASSILSLLDDQEEQVTHLAIAFDNPIRSFRNDLFDGYKSDEGVPPELRDQFDDVEEAMRALGVTVWSMDQFEADDALSTAATLYSKEFEQIRLMTPDKDLGQCLTGERVVQVDRLRKKIIDEAAFRALRGIAPESLPDYLALVGDSADGIPGLPGFGEKSTSTLLAHYGHLEQIPDDAEDWEVKIRGAARLAATLSEGREDAMLYRTLATLRTDVPLTDKKADLAHRGVPKNRFEAWCDSVGAKRGLRNRPKRWA